MNRERSGNGSAANGHRSRSPWKLLVTGATGAATMTVAHEVVHQLIPGAPRTQRVGIRGLLFAPLALSHGRPWLRGLALGALAGLGVALLTPRTRRPRPHRGVTQRGQAMTVALYAAGGLAAGLMASLLDRPTRAPALAPGVVDFPKPTEAM